MRDKDKVFATYIEMNSNQQIFESFIFTEIISASQIKDVMDILHTKTLFLVSYSGDDSVFKVIILMNHEEFLKIYNSEISTYSFYSPFSIFKK